MYSAGFYPFKSQEEKWAYWSRHIYCNRYDVPAGKAYLDLFQLVKDKDYFVITTNVDHQFHLAGFSEKRLFATQGDYGLFQCARACHKKLYDNERQVREMTRTQKDCRIPSELVPKCPVCGGDMEVNLRSDSYFVEDEAWDQAARGYEKFLSRNLKKRILFIELGVGMNTPAIIKYPFWNMARRGPKAVYICINKGEAWTPEEIRRKSICLDADIESALASIELNHGGQFCVPVTGNKLLGPSEKSLDNGMRVAAMTEEDMDRVATYFAKAAVIGKRGGFDIVNIHAGHNWLLGAFFSPIENHRRDQFGGSVENRARFPKMVLERIREYVGDDMIISMRFSGCETIEGGITLEDTIKTLKIMEETADIIQCSAGMIHRELTEGFTFPLQYMRHGCNTYIAREVKKHCKKAVIETIGAINQPEMAEQLIADGTADLVGMARSFLADPDWAEKVRCGREDEIRPCIRCIRCLNYSAVAGQGTGTSICTVNPRRVFPSPLAPSYLLEKEKKVMVIGGGPAGMKAAVELARKGHYVDLYEKTEKLGGRLEFADYMEFKEDIRRYREYLANLVRKSDRIQVHFNCEVTREMIDDKQPDAVIVAAGAVPFFPPISGVERDHVIHASDVFGKEGDLGEAVLIIGGGQVGCELAVHLKAYGKKIKVVEMGDQLMPDAYDTPEERYWTIFCMEHDFARTSRDSISAPETDTVSVYLQTKCVEVTEQGVFVKRADGEKELLKADSVIMATGLRPDLETLETFENSAYDVIRVGDCDKVGNLLGTSSSAYRASVRV